MQNIPLIDLPKQYSHIKNEANSKVLKILENGAYIGGKAVADFEEKAAKYLYSKYALSCANGSDAIYISLLALGIGQGDEVITTDFTYIASSEAIDQCGATPVLVDVNQNNFNICPLAIENAITCKTKAIVVVHLYGQAAPMQEILALAKKYDLKIIEDSAQAFGSKVLIDGEWRYVGTIGDLGTFSFYPTKNLSCAGDGGMITCQNENLANKVKIIKSHGSEQRYYHSCLGINSRLDALQAEILNIKLDHIEKWNSMRVTNSAYYAQSLKFKTIADKIALPELMTYSKHVFHQYTIKLKPASIASKTVDILQLSKPELKNLAAKRDQLKQYLRDKGVACEVYYPLALHQQEVYKDLNYSDDANPITKYCCAASLSIPIFPELKDEQQDYVIDKIVQFFN